MENSIIIFLLLKPSLIVPIPFLKNILNVSVLNIFEQTLSSTGLYNLLKFPHCIPIEILNMGCFENYLLFSYPFSVHILDLASS